LGGSGRPRNLTWDLVSSWIEQVNLPPPPLPGWPPWLLPLSHTTVQLFGGWNTSWQPPLAAAAWPAAAPAAARAGVAPGTASAAAISAVRLSASSTAPRRDLMACMGPPPAACCSLATGRRTAPG